MISSLRGIIKDIMPQKITLSVGQIDFAIAVPAENLFFAEQKAELHIYFHWNQENGPMLFGFTSALAKTVFGLIISCSGLGPKIGLAILAQMAPEQFLQSIALADLKALSSISGIGAKKAESMIMQLKDKVASISYWENKIPEGTCLVKIKQVSEALSSLNYSRTEINSALEHVKKDQMLDSSTFDILLRKALSFLAKRI